jgi:hypothetical protein
LDGVGGRQFQHNWTPSRGSSDRSRKDLPPAR